MEDLSEVAVEVAAHRMILMSLVTSGICSLLVLFSWKYWRISSKVLASEIPLKFPMTHSSWCSLSSLKSLPRVLTTSLILPSKAFPLAAAQRISSALLNSVAPSEPNFLSSSSSMQLIASRISAKILAFGVAKVLGALAIPDWSARTVGCLTRGSSGMVKSRFLARVST